MKESELCWRVVGEHSPDLIMIVNGHGRIELVNRVPPGWEEQELLGTRALDLVDEADRREYREALERALSTGHEVAVDCLGVAEGQRACLCRIVPFDDDVDGERVRKLIVFATDVTEQREAAEAFRHKEEELHQAQKMEAIGRLAGGIAHDFNNLLAVILSYAEFAKSAVYREPDVQKDIDEIITAAKRGAALTRQLLTFGRKRLTKPVPLDLNAVLGEMHSLLSRLLGEAVELTIDGSSDYAPVLIDPAQIEQILMNLAVNARDAMPRGGSLRLSVSVVEVDEANRPEGFTLELGRYVLLDSTDTGIGMSRDTMQRLFEPFFSTKDQRHGFGLGLSTVNSIVTSSGGQILVTSQVGDGAAFRVYLPWYQGLDAPVLFDTGQVRLLKGSETILVVEDDTIIRNAVCRILGMFDYHTLDAASGEEALAVARQLPRTIELLLTDVVLTGDLDGVELGRLLCEKRPGLRGVFMSGYAGHAFAEDHPGVPRFSLIDKPFTSDELLTAVRTTLDGP